MNGRLRLNGFAAVLLLTPILASTLAGSEFSVTENDVQIRITTSAIEASIIKRGYVSGVGRQSFLDKETGFRDPGWGLDIADFLLEPGSDRAYRNGLDPRLIYEYDNPKHGSRAKRIVEGPQICTRAKEVRPEVIRGKDFVAVSMDFRYYLSAPDKKSGSTWRQTIVFPAGKRYFLSSDRITSANDSDNVALRIDLPGHVKHKNGDTFEEVFLSYHGRIPAREFLEDFPPDGKFHYLRSDTAIPRRIIRAYRLRDPATGRQGPWLAGMTLDPSVVYEAWCHQRGYLCMIQEIWGRPVRAGQSFSAAYVVGYFDSIEEMEQVYDRYRGAVEVQADGNGWRLSHRQPGP